MTEQILYSLLWATLGMIGTITVLSGKEEKRTIFLIGAVSFIGFFVLSYLLDFPMRLFS